MKIKVNDAITRINKGATVRAVRDRTKPDADIVVLNGYTASGDELLDEGDILHLIKRGEVPSQEELEDLLVARHSPGVHQRMKEAVVGVAGLGGLGSSCAVALCRMGIGKMILADFDVVEPSNLNRQQYFVDQIGMYKTDALRCNLARINPFISIDTYCLTLDESNIPFVFPGASIVVEAFDAAVMKAMLIRTILAKMADTYVVAASGLAGYGDGNEIRTLCVSPRLYVTGDFRSEAGPHMGLMAPRVGIAAHQQANTVVRILMGERG